MQVKFVSNIELDKWWEKSRSYLADGLNTGDGETDLSQLRMLCSEGRSFLAVMIDDNDMVNAAMVFQFNNLPNFRIAYITCIGGKNVIIQKELWAQFVNFCKLNGASKIRASCKLSQTRLWRKMGFVEIYKLIQIQL